MGLLPFVIYAEGVGGRVEIDGEDVTARVAAIDLHISDTEPSVLTLHHKPGTGSVEGEAIIRLVAYDQTPADLIRAFLDSVDPGALEQTVTETMDWATSTGEAFLAALKALLT